MAQENIIGAIQLPMRVLKKVLPIEGATATLGAEQHTKVEFKGKSYLIHWVPAIHVIAVGDLELIEKEIAEADQQKTLQNKRKQAADALKVKFNELTATPVTDED
jgi:hypothetical protein